jgi:hypothetical protein
MFNSELAKRLAAAGILAAGIGAERSLAGVPCGPQALAVCSGACAYFWGQGEQSPWCTETAYGSPGNPDIVLYCGCTDAPSILCEVTNEGVDCYPY